MSMEKLFFLVMWSILTVRWKSEEKKEIFNNLLPATLFQFFRSEWFVSKVNFAMEEMPTNDYKKLELNENPKFLM